MAGNLKNRARTSSDGRGVNADLSRADGGPAPDPRFHDEDTSHVDTDTDSGLTVSGGKISVKPRSKSSDLPGYPVNKNPFVATHTGRTSK
jgi:hypothetical protein